MPLAALVQSLPCQEPASSIYGGVYRRSPLPSPSYHFYEKDSYMSYIGVPSDRLTLDDSSLPPTRKIFSETSWDSFSRTFNGVIDWDPAFVGYTKFEYSMVFDAEFKQIVAGSWVGTPVNSSFGRHIGSYEDPSKLPYRRVGAFGCAVVRDIDCFLGLGEKCLLIHGAFGALVLIWVLTFLRVLCCCGRSAGVARPVTQPPATTQQSGMAQAAVAKASSGPPAQTGRHLTPRPGGAN